MKHIFLRLALIGVICFQWGCSKEKGPPLTMKDLHTFPYCDLSGQVENLKEYREHAQINSSKNSRRPLVKDRREIIARVVKTRPFVIEVLSPLPKNGDQLPYMGPLYDDYRLYEGINFRPQDLPMLKGLKVNDIFRTEIQKIEDNFSINFVPVAQASTIAIFPYRLGEASLIYDIDELKSKLDPDYSKGLLLSFPLSKNDREHLWVFSDGSLEKVQFDNLNQVENRQQGIPLNESEQKELMGIMKAIDFQSKVLEDQGKDLLWSNSGDQLLFVCNGLDRLSINAGNIKTFEPLLSFLNKKFVSKIDKHIRVIARYPIIIWPLSETDPLKKQFYAEPNTSAHYTGTIKHLLTEKDKELLKWPILFREGEDIFHIYRYADLYGGIEWGLDRIINNKGEYNNSSGTPHGVLLPSKPERASGHFYDFWPSEPLGYSLREIYKAGGKKEISEINYRDNVGFYESLGAYYDSPSWYVENDYLYHVELE